MPPKPLFNIGRDIPLADGRDGRLLSICSAGCDFRDVADAMRGRGLIGGTGRAFMPNLAADAKRQAEELAERERAIRRARNVWADAAPIADTLAERYLRARAIRAPLPETLRFHPAAWHGGTTTKHPAMVAVVERAGEIVGVHRTFLAEPGRKADVSPDKMMLGPVQGGAVRLSDGAGPLVVAEGIERRFRFSTRSRATLRVSGPRSRLRASRGSRFPCRRAS